VQLVRALAVWADTATFAIRYLAAHGAIRIFLIARPHDLADEGVLGREVEALLHSYKIVSHAGTTRLAPQALQRLCALSSPVFAELTQQTSKTLWASEGLGGRWRSNATGSGSELTEDDYQNPAVVFRWRGPGGSFLAPMELLAAPTPSKRVLRNCPLTTSRLAWPDGVVQIRTEPTSS